jgi:hypothetical protein
MSNGGGCVASGLRSAERIVVERRDVPIMLGSTGADMQILTCPAGVN